MEQSRERIDHMEIPYTSVLYLLKREPSGHLRLWLPTLLYIYICHLHHQVTLNGFFWLCLTIHLYHPSLLVGPLSCIQCLYRDDVYKSLLVDQHWICPSIGVHKRILCPWCNGYHCRKWTQRHKFKSWTRLIAFHIALIPLGKVWIQ